MSDKPKNFVLETKHWEIYLNPDQYYLARCVVSVKRDVGAISDLRKEEWLDFVKLVKRLEISFKKTFGATMFNWTCLMNNAFQEELPKPHVHWHFRPRYRNTVEFAGMKFEDKEFGHHYARGTESLVPDKIFEEIIEVIKKTNS